MSGDGLTFFYGGYEHLKGEVYPYKIEIFPRKSNRGVRWASLHRMTVKGNFLDVNPELDDAGVNARMVAMRNAYLHDYKNCGFKLDDGTVTRHFFDNDDAENLSGNVISYRSWDNMTDTELANTRSFTVAIESLWQESYSGLYYFRETLERFGDGGEVWRMYNNWEGDPVRETIFNKSKVYIVQRGLIIAQDFHIAPPDPWFPDDEQGWRQEEYLESPTYHGDPTFSLAKATHFITRYAYYFEDLGPHTQTPNPWLLAPQGLGYT